jgi:hypothetical protein
MMRAMQLARQVTLAAAYGRNNTFADAHRP